MTTTLRGLLGALLCLPLAAATLPACSLVVATDGAQCKVDDDCAARGFTGTVCLDSVCKPKPDTKWGCIGNVPAIMSGSMTNVTVNVIDAVLMTPPKGLSAKLCSKYDTQCTSPVEPSVPVGGGGALSATVPSDFQGYFDVTAPSYPEALVFLDLANQAMNPDINIVTSVIATALAQQAHVAIDPTAGIVLGRAVDCAHQRTAGVSLSMFPSQKETGFYFIQNGAVPTATATDDAGNGGFLNVAPGTPTITATIGPGGREIGKVSTLVRKGAITYQILGPTPTL